MAVIKEFLRLPSTIVFEGVEFVPTIINNGSRDARLVYEILSVEEGSPHKGSIAEYGCFQNRLLDSNCGFLFLIENMTTDKDFDVAILETRRFLLKHGLIKKLFDREQSRERPHA